MLSTYLERDTGIRYSRLKCFRSDVVSQSLACCLFICPNSNKRPKPWPELFSPQLLLSAAFLRALKEKSTKGQAQAA